MAFLNPIMLFGLTAVSVPIIIHLLNRRRFQKVVWAAMRFLKLSVEQNQRRMQIEDLILLLLRCLLLGLIAKKVGAHVEDDPQIRALEEATHPDSLVRQIEDAYRDTPGA